MILLLGKNGQVGWELQRALAPLGPVVALDRYGHDGLCGDLAEQENLRVTIRKLKPSVIVNAAAYTAVDSAEEDRELANVINAEAPELLAVEAEKLGALLIHYSTDYVFDGSGEVAWKEEDTTSPVNYYGASKMAGERAIQASGCLHLIFRTSWVYSTRGHNFLATMAKLIRQRDALKVINDQFGAPTGADLIADVTAHALTSTIKSPELAGLYHLVAAGETSWHGYATLIAQWYEGQSIQIQATPECIEPVPSTAWPTPARRPLNSRLSTARLESAFGLQMPPWQSGVERALAERYISIAEIKG